MHVSLKFRCMNETVNTYGTSYASSNSNYEASPKNVSIPETKIGRFFVCFLFGFVFVCSDVSSGEIRVGVIVQKLSRRIRIHSSEK